MWVMEKLIKVFDVWYLLLYEYILFYKLQQNICIQFVLFNNILLFRLFLLMKKFIVLLFYVFVDLYVIFCVKNLIFNFVVCGFLLILL